MKLVETPPIRRLFIPDDGYVLFEADLKRADPQVVAKESNETTLLDAFRKNLDIYTEYAQWVYETDTITKEQRQWNKNAVNGINYACKERTLAATLHTTVTKAEEYIARHFRKYPGIKEWHRRVERQLRQYHYVKNVYGFRRYYSDRLDNLLPQALAWIASSTVSVTINRGMMNVYENLPDVLLLLQIHDSILGEISLGTKDDILPLVRAEMEVEIPYEVPLTIPATIKTSSRSWGDVKDWEQ